MPRKDNYTFARTHKGVGVDPIVAYAAAAAKDGREMASLHIPGAARALASFRALYSAADVRASIECGDFSDEQMVEFEFLAKWIATHPQ